MRPLTVPLGIVTVLVALSIWAGCDWVSTDLRNPAETPASKRDLSAGAEASGLQTPEEVHLLERLMQDTTVRRFLWDAYISMMAH